MAVDVFWSLTFLTDFQKAKDLVQQAVSALSEHADKRWKTPATGTVKLNVDACVNEKSNQYSIAGVLRDCQGRLLLAFDKQISQPLSVAHGELLAIREGVKLVYEKNFRHVLVVSDSVLTVYRRFLGTSCSISRMGSEMTSLVSTRKHANFRIINVSGYKADLLEIHCQDPTFHVLFIPGNPGVISFYTEFLESLFELLGGTARVTAIGHVSHTQKNWESGRLFSLQEQIEHKISFIEHVFQDALPIVLVGHSIGSHISLELFRRYQDKVIYCICLYPFLAMDAASSKQATIRRIAVSPALSNGISSLGAFLGFLPARFSRFIAKKILGKSCSSSTVEVLCTHVFKYHVMRNMLFMVKTEFEKLPEKPDFDFIGGNKSKLAFLFGSDDHWGPLHLYEEIYEKVPDATLAIEREGYTHAFSCTDAGSTWVAQHVRSLIKNHLPLFHN